jgi:hypothetical protein
LLLSYGDIDNKDAIFTINFHFSRELMKLTRSTTCFQRKKIFNSIYNIFQHNKVRKQESMTYSIGRIEQKDILKMNKDQNLLYKVNSKHFSNNDAN